MDGDTSITNTPGGMPPQGGEGGTSQGTQTPTDSWTSMLVDESLRGLPSLTRYKDADAFVRGHLELEKTVGQKGIKPLTAESTPEEITAYRTALGVPEKPDGYDLGQLDFPEAATPTEAAIMGFKGLAHEIGLTPQQAQKIAQWHAHSTSEEWNALDDQRTAQNKATMEGLTKKYGAQAPQLLVMAQKYVERRYGAEGLQALDFTQGGMGSNPLMIEMLIESAKLTGHDKFIVADSGGSMMDSTAARQKHDELTQKYYRTQDESEKISLKAEMDRLGPLAFGR